MGKLEKSLYWLCFIVILYAIIGFKLVPLILKDQLIKNLDENLTLKSNIEKIEFNPFLTSLKIHNFKLSDENNNSDVSFKELNIDFAVLRSIEKKHISFQNAFLDELFLNINEEKDGSFNLSKILKSTNKEKKEENTTSSNIKFLISKIDLKNANINFTSLINKKPFKLNLKNINYVIYDFGTYKNSLSSNNLNFKINENTDVSIGGANKLEPFKMYGKISVKNLKINDFLDFKQNLFNFDINKDANINLVLNYNIDTSKELDLQLNTQSFELNNLILKQKNKTLASLKKLDIKKFDFDLLSQNISIDGINIEELNSNIILDKNGINLANLIKNSPSKEKETTTNKDPKPWKINLSDIKIASNLNFEDKINNNLLSTKQTKLNLKNLQIVNSKIDLNKLQINNANLNFKNNMTKLDINSKNTKIILDKMALNNSIININNIRLSKDYLEILDKKSKIDIKAKDINFDIKKLLTEKNTLKIEKIDLINSQISVILAKKQKQKNEEKNPSKTVKNREKQNSTNQMKLDIGPVDIKNATFNFEDKNLPISFKTTVSKLNGKISEIKNSELSKTNLEVNGVVDKYGVAKITGIVNPNNIKFLTDVNLKFKNIAMKNFTPYTGKFLGRELKSGKLDLDLKYNIEKSNLEAKNNIVITKLELGKNIQSSDAIFLPLEIAIALLEDKNNVIDINLPVSGNVDDPQFSVGSIVWKAFVNLITKAVTAPFSILGAIFNFGEDEINSVKFDLLENEITPIQKETLDKIAQILNAKKDIAIKFSPSFDETQETFALKEKKYLAKNSDKKLSKEEIKALIEKEIIKKEELEKIAKNRVSNIKNYLIKDKRINPKQIILSNEIITSKSSIDLKIEQIK